jgi:hypothetical protein
MAISKEQIERIAKEVVDESCEDIGKESDKNNSKMYLGLVIGITRFMDKIKEQD